MAFQATLRSVAALPFALAALSPLTAQISEYFLVTGDQARFHVVQNGVLLRSWSPAPGTDNYQYPIAVTSTVRAMGKNPGGIGAQYGLQGNDLGTRYPNPGGAVGACWDGTTDGTYNYAIDTSGMVHRFDRDWANPIALFDAGGIGSLTYDPASQTLWVSQFSTSTIVEYTLAGSQVSSFSTGHTQNMALALDHATGTLWLHNRTAQGTLEEWSRTGTMQQQVAVPGLSTQNCLGGEMPFPGSASCAFRNGSGINATGFDCIAPPQLGGTWITSTPTNANTLGTYVGLGLVPSSGTMLLGGELLVALSPAPVMLAGNGTTSATLSGNTAFVGLALYSQGVRLDIVGGAAQLVFFNAQDLTLGY